MPDRRCIRSRLPAAFTAVELIIVVLILGITSAVAVPKYAASLSQRRVAAAAQRIVADFELARRQARMASESRRLLFTPAADSYTLENTSHLDRPSDPYLVSLSDSPYEVDLVSADFEGAAEISFNGHGVPLASGTAVVRAGAYTKTVRVDKTTGSISVE